MTGDGAAYHMYHDGEESALTIVDGANDGKWFDYATDANVFSIAALRRAAVIAPYNGKESKVVIRDDVLSPIQIAKLAQSSALGWNRQYWA